MSSASLSFWNQQPICRDDTLLSKHHPAKGKEWVLVWLGESPGNLIQWGL
jgi:hypothetical protein